MKKLVATICWVLSIFLLNCIFCSKSRAEIYVYEDANGVRHFTNVPNSSKFRVFMREEQNGVVQGLFVSDRYDHYIERAAKIHGVSFPLIKAVIKVESNFNPKAVSRKGALGLMQIMPYNLRDFNINDPFDPWENILGGAGYLRDMLKRYGQVSLALAAYNAGPSTVDEYNDIPPYPETQDYVQRVMRYYRFIRNQ